MCSEQAQIHTALLSTSPFTITLQLHHPQHRFDRQFLLLENLEASVKNEALFIKLWWRAWSKRKVKQIAHPFCWTLYTPKITSAHKNLRHGGFISTNEMRVAFLFLKSPWYVFHLLKKTQPGSSRRLRRGIWGISGYPASNQSGCALSLHHTLTMTLCDRRYNVISPVPRVWGWWWRLLGSSLLASDSLDRRGEKKKERKQLSLMVYGVFHTTWRSLSLFTALQCNKN